MTTFSSLLTDCRDLIGDSGSAVFTDQQVELWINNAIQQLSIFFPRRMTMDIDTVTAQRKYDIDAEIVSILSCEYPAGQAHLYMDKCDRIY